jgi:hypothetical protein
LPLIPLCAADVPLPLEVQHSIYNQIVGQKKKKQKKQKQHQYPTLCLKKQSNNITLTSIVMVAFP